MSEPVAKPDSTFEKTTCCNHTSSDFVSERVALLQCTAPPTSSWTVASPNESVSEALEQKFKYFKALKEQGIHFNASLDKSTSFKNPRLLDRLADFVGIVDPYGSNLPIELQSWRQLPPELKADCLGKRVIAEKQSKQSQSSTQKTQVQFVPAKNPAK
ncbi:hypothetical protein PORY_000364 [Pneumocystis oryctolagi]|uniref:Uncharacterized protein n=1 Tax=Pneumocystis oryctolagi TaxID=42067 RepID=A0ACB7CEZ1_9ASCO|nr:hypothetical protein PORY_000364 [Pneumocystis oryctolagi]